MTPSIPPLYHYSAPSGLLGVFQSKSLWLSNVHYLNDSDEYYHALDLIKEIIEKEYTGLPLFNVDFTRKTIFDVYTFSLTEKKDLLSQWRGYCPSGGYSFRINNDQLVSNLQRYYLKLAPVIYNQDAKIRFIKETIIGFTPEEFARREEIGSNSLAYRFSSKSMPAKVAKLLRRNILNYAALLKHESFLEEQEWRIITFDEYDGIFAGMYDIKPKPRGLDVKFREGSNTLIPFLEVPFTNDGSSVMFDEVVIGPTPHPELSEYSLNLLLKPSSPSVIITPSSTPYRNW